jgi:hypothetical protein
VTKSASQLDAEIAAVLAKPKRRIITITTYHRIDDDHDYEAWQVSDDGDDFDDSEEYNDRTEASDDADERHAHYAKQDPNAAIKLRDV